MSMRLQIANYYLFNLCWPTRLAMQLYVSSAFEEEISNYQVYHIFLNESKLYFLIINFCIKLCTFACKWALRVEYREIQVFCILEYFLQFANSK